MILRSLALLAGFVILLASSARAQPPSLPFPRLFTITPLGGQVGTTVRVMTTGADLEEALLLQFDHPGLVAIPVPDPSRPGCLLPNHFDVQIAANTPVGLYEVRAIGQYGISNPRVFVVGDLPELLEVEPNNDAPQAQPVELNSVVNGVIANRVDVDYWRFKGTKGQQVVIHCAAGSIDSRLDPELQVLAAAGEKLGASWRYRDMDACVGLVLPADGEYLVRLCQRAHLFGDAHHFYRLTLTTGPWIEAAFPNVLTEGRITPVTFWGRNLPGGVPDPATLLDGVPLEKVTVPLAPPDDPRLHAGLLHRDARTANQVRLDAFEHRLRSPASTSNPILLMSSPHPVVLSAGTNTAPERAQPVELPCELAGRFLEPRHGHWFVFEGKANEAVWIEGYGDRVLNPLDLWFEVRRADNQQVLAEVDDHPEAFAPLRFFARTEDPKGRIVLPADGKYLVMVGHRGGEHDFGPRHVYRLALRRDEPDFRVLVLDRNIQSPGAIHVPAGSNRAAEIYVHRADGFNGPVTLRAEGLPPGLTAQPQVIPAGVPAGFFTLTASEGAPPWVGTFRLIASAQIGGRTVERAVRAGALVWPNPGEVNGAVAWSRVCQQLALAVGPPPPFTMDLGLSEVGVPVGGTIPLKVSIQRRWPEANVPIAISALSLPPNAVFNRNNQPVVVQPNVTSVEVTIQIPANVPPGEYTLNLIASAGGPFNKNPQAPQKPPVTVQEVGVPIRLTVFNKVAELSVNTPAVTLKAGATTEVLVAVRRLHGFRGPVDVQLVPPAGNTTVSAAPRRVADAEDLGTLVLKTPPFTPAAAAVPFVVRATARVGNVDLTSDTPVHIAIVRE